MRYRTENLFCAAVAAILLLTLLGMWFSPQIIQFSIGERDISTGNAGFSATVFAFLMRACPLAIYGIVMWSGSRLGLITKRMAVAALLAVLVAVSAIYYAEIPMFGRFMRSFNSHMWLDLLVMHIAFPAAVIGVGVAAGEWLHRRQSLRRLLLEASDPPTPSSWRGVVVALLLLVPPGVVVFKSVVRNRRNEAMHLAVRTAIQQRFGGYVDCMILTGGGAKMFLGVEPADVTAWRSELIGMEFAGTDLVLYENAGPLLPFTGAPWLRHVQRCGPIGTVQDYRSMSPEELRRAILEAIPPKPED